MSGKPQREWPGDSELIELHYRLGTRQAVADDLSVAPSSIRYRTKQKGIEGACQDAMHRASEEGRGQAQAQGPPDATTREGRRELETRAELNWYKSEHKKLSEQLMSQERLFDRFVDAAVAPRPAPMFSSARSDGAKKRDVILHLSDLHYGEEVRPEDVPNALETFNVDVIRERAKRYVDAVGNSLEDLSAGHTVENLVIALGGDMVTGDDIFRGQPWQLDRHPVDQVLECADLLGSMFHEIIGVAKENVGVHEIALMCVVGNHGAVGGRQAGARPSTYSWDYLLYKVLERTLAGYPIDSMVIEPGGSLYFGTKNHVGQLIHGDEIRGWASIPFYGIGRFDSRSIRMSNLVPDFVLMGHIHQRAEIPIGYGEVFTSGSWMAANNLARNVGAGAPTQNMLIVSEEYGVAQRNTIHLQTRDERRNSPSIHVVGG